MTKDTAGFAALLRLELRRCGPAVARGMISPAILVAWGVLARATRPDFIVLGLAGALVLAAGLVAIQVGRDRDDGVLSYFSSMPIRGEMLVGVRFATAGILSAAVAPFLTGFGHLFFPAIPFSIVVRATFGLWAFATLGACILIAPLSRYRWSTIVAGIFVSLFVIGAVLDRTGLGDRLSRSAAEQFQTGDPGPAVALVLALALLALSVGLVASFIYSVRSLQPNGGAPTARARAMLVDRGQLNKE